MCIAAASHAARASTPSQLDRLEIAVTRAEDVRAIKKLQRAYGYYADRGLWDDLADLFTDDAIANYPSGGFDGNASIRAMFVQNLGQGKPGLAEGRIYNHTILQPVVDLAPDGATATGRWRVLGMLGRLGGTATWADSLYRFDYVKQDGRWKIKSLTAYAGLGRRLRARAGYCRSRGRRVRSTPRRCDSIWRIRPIGRGSIPARRTSPCAWCRFPIRIGARSGAPANVIGGDRPSAAIDERRPRRSAAPRAAP